MIAHVAEASENSGRVILSLSATEPLFRRAVDAALHVSRSFNAGLDSLVIEDPGLAELKKFAFVREAKVSRAALAEPPARHEVSAVKRLHCEIELEASRYEIPCRQRTMEASLIDALRQSCHENGRWNLAVFGNPVSATTEREVSGVFEQLDDVTAAVVVARHARRSEGPAIAIVERLDHLEAMLRAAERLGGDAGGYVVLFGTGEAGSPSLEEQARLMLGPDQRSALLTRETFGCPGVLAAALERFKAHTVIAALGGALLPPEGGLQAFAKLHDGPLFLVRSGS